MRNGFFAACSLSLTLGLGGCGGDGGGPDPIVTYDDAVSAVTISPARIERIGRDIPQAGTYAITLSGQFTPSQVSGGDQLIIRVAVVGSGTVSGDSQLTYPLGSAGQPVQIDGHATAVLTGSGPWQIWVLYQSQDATGDLANLRVHTEGH